MAPNHMSNISDYNLYASNRKASEWMPEKHLNTGIRKTLAERSSAGRHARQINASSLIADKA